MEMKENFDKENKIVSVGMNVGGCCICGPVKNCGSYLPKVLENIEKIGSLFNHYCIVIYYDKSDDNSLEILENYQKINPKCMVYININKISKFRTHNLAIARNFCLNFVRKNVEKYPYFIMMDFDDVNAKEININVIAKYLYFNSKINLWDGLTFNTSPDYYDIWALSINPYCFSYNHFENNVQNYKIIQRYVTTLLKEASKNKLSLVKCISAFNGFGIYKTSKFLNTYYDGRIRLDLIPRENLEKHMKVTNSKKIIYKKYVTVDGRYEDCEHRAFHIMANKNSGANIYIAPDIVFL